MTGRLFYLHIDSLAWKRFKRMYRSKQDAGYIALPYLRPQIIRV